MLAWRRGSWSPSPLSPRPEFLRIKKAHDGDGRTRLTLRKRTSAGAPADLPLDSLVLWLEIAANVGTAR